MEPYPFFTQPERVTYLNRKNYPESRNLVIYWMQASVRIVDNLALAKAMQISRETGRHLKVVFHLNSRFPEANYRHFLFLADGLRDVMSQLQRNRISFELLSGDFYQDFTRVGQEAFCIVCDRGYLRIQREQQEWLAKEMPCPVIAIEDNLLVPVESASYKAEWAARTLRPKLAGKLEYFSGAFTPFDYDRSESPVTADAHNVARLDHFLEEVKQQRYLSPVTMRGGEGEAIRLLDAFVAEKLARYDADRNHPALQATSRLSAYLHFGMISPLTIYRRCASLPGAAPFIEQLIVRRELAHNYIYYTPRYDCYEALPEWSRRTLREHAADQRPYLYDCATLESAATHDPCWNAAMREMLQTGYMENTMRMYWGKKIIEWSKSPEEAFQTMLLLNNRYFVDGRDANSFVGVGWCFGLHDRPWQERPVFGLVRYMNEAGLRRKYDMEKYIALF